MAASVAPVLPCQLPASYLQATCQLPASYEGSWPAPEAAGYSALASGTAFSSTEGSAFGTSCSE